MFKILDVSAFDIRVEALRQAVAYAKQSQFTAKETVEIAEIFEDFLRGVDDGQEDV